MEHVVLATAGHIDHGKTELTRALTGIDTDRLPEEKARGITIDIGFAHAELGGRQVAIVDVPGHERFVKNMLAGVGGIDLALLIVAADESVMPQTREHLAILELLGVGGGVVALTKLDLVDEEMLEIVRLEVAEFVRDSFLAQAPVVPVSARTSQGLEELRAVLGRVVAGVTPRSADGPLRLHLDRAFSMRGFGTVVTGTVVSGSVRLGEEVEVSPRGLLARVRGLQAHGQPVAEVHAGGRAALNLTGIDLEVLERGQQLLEPGLFPPAGLLDVHLKLLGSSAPLGDLSRVRFHLGSGERLARVRLLDAPGRILAPGASAYAQLRLEAPVVAWPGDRFVLRSYSPMTTIGGGVVLDRPERKHGWRSQAAGTLAALAAADRRGRLEMLVAAAGARGLGVGELAARTGLRADQVETELSAGGGTVRVAAAGPRYFAPQAWQALAELAVAALSAFHAREPLQEGMSREELRGRLCGGDAASVRQLLAELEGLGRIRLQGERAALASHRVSFKPQEAEAKQALEEVYRRGGLNPPALKEALSGLGPRLSGAEKLVPVLVREGRLVALPQGLYVHADALADLKQRLAGRQSVTVTEFKELTATSRRMAIPLLEHLDAIRFTRRQGDLRIVVGER